MLSHAWQAISRIRLLNGTRSFSRVTMNSFPATFMRGGTSKGIFLKRESLPEDQAKWDSIFLGIMGSPDPIHGRQLNGMGGGVSSLSKIMIVGEPSEHASGLDVDVEYTFAQIGIKDSMIDYSGNCGNLSSVIGVFAVDEGMCKPRIKMTDPAVGVVRAFNTNTSKVIETTFPLDDARLPDLNLEQAEVAGVPGKASRIDLDFIAPGGARTGKLLPSDNTKDTLDVSVEGQQFQIPVSLIDATNPTVFLSLSDLAQTLQASNLQDVDLAASRPVAFVEAIRRAGALRMGLDPNAQAQPKIAVLSSVSGEEHTQDDADIVVKAFSMGVLHRAVPMTLGLCLGVASCVKGTLAWELVQESRKKASGVRADDSLVRISHPSGLVDVGAVFDNVGEVASAKVVRTGRRLMKGVVWCS